MPQYLLDTNHLTYYEFGHPLVRSRVDSLTSGDVVVSIVSVDESLRGRLAVVRAARTTSTSISAYQKFLTTLQCIQRFALIPFDQVAGIEFNRLVAMRLRVGTQDVRIAAIGLANQLTVVTANTQDFGKIPNLTVVDWSV